MANVFKIVTVYNGADILYSWSCSLLIVVACSVPTQELLQETDMRLREGLRRLYYIPEVMLTVWKGRAEFN